MAGLRVVRRTSRSGYGVRRIPPAQRIRPATDVRTGSASYAGGVAQSERVARDEDGGRSVPRMSPGAVSGNPRPTVPPVPIDAALALVVTVAIGFAIAAKVEPEAAEPDALAYSFALALGGLMFLRRRWPAGVLIATMALLAAYYALGYPAVGVSVPIAGAVYSAAEQGRLRLAILAAGAVLVVSTLYRLTEEPAARLLG